MNRDEIEGTRGFAKTDTYRANLLDVLINRVRAVRVDYTAAIAVDFVLR